MLIRNWKLDFEKYKGLEAKIPCSLYSVLLQYDLIPHPYYQRDESEVFKLSEKDCVFYTEFEVGEKEHEKSSKEFDIRPATETPKKRNIPDAKHPWRSETFLKYRMYGLTEAMLVS